MNSSLFDLKGYCSFVTGAGRGLGRTMAFGLAEFGSNVVIADIDIENAKKTAEELEKLGVKSLALKMDVTSPKDVEAAVEQVINKFGKIDVLVNNAGIVEHAKAEDMNYEDWCHTMDVNLNGVFLVSKVVGKTMIKQNYGSIINISSMSGIIVNIPQTQAAYNASKAGVILLTKSLASEWVKYNIRVNTIAPGYMRSEMTAKFLVRNVKVADFWMERTPMGRPGEPEELKGMVVYLASKASSFVTGSVFVIDGGYTIW